MGLLVNPASGGGAGRERAREVADLLAGHDLRKRHTESPPGAGPPAADLAREVDVLVVVGGDGTIREVVEAVAGDREAPPLLPVPAGRGNSTVAHLYGGDGWREAARDLAPDPPTRPLDAGLLEAQGWGPHVFVLGASVGLLAAAVRAADRIPLLPGTAGYLAGTSLSWAAGGAGEVRVRVDGDLLHEGPARLAALGGGRFRGGGVPLFPGASLADGLLDVLVVGDVPPWRVPGLARDVRRGTHVDRPEVTHARGRQVVLDRGGRGDAELDGTLFKGAPARLEAQVLPGAADVVAREDAGGDAPA